MRSGLTVRFYRTTGGKELVRDWLVGQVSPAARKVIGADIKTVQFGWQCRKRISTWRCSA